MMLSSLVSDEVYTIKTFIMPILLKSTNDSNHNFEKQLETPVAILS